MNEVKEAPKSAIGMFFKLGDKITGGDPKKKADFDYYLLWSMFLAFFSIMITQIITGVRLIKVDEFWLAVKSFAWAFVMLAIVWFQYSALKGTWENRKRIKNLPTVKDLKPDNKPIEEDIVEEMEAEFKDE